MNNFLRLLAVALLAGPMTAAANIVFNFTGNCSIVGCPSTSDSASAVLTLADTYQFGTPLTNAVFVSLSYSSGDIPFSISAGNLTGLSGVINANNSLGADLGIASLNNSLFIDDNTPFWSAISLAPRDSNQGNGYTFTRSATIPEPATFALLGLGLSGLALMRRRRTN